MPTHSREMTVTTLVPLFLPGILRSRTNSSPPALAALSAALTVERQTPLKAASASIGSVQAPPLALPPNDSQDRELAKGEIGGDFGWDDAAHGLAAPPFYRAPPIRAARRAPGGP